ncbi:MAG: hypothetical protein NTY19_17455 [Planctomycetota bacterium]|nr:hypothetical protein [Planctomycetota bacterium]
MFARRLCLPSLVLIASGVLAGCQKLPAEKGLLEQNVAGAHLSSHKLRILVTDYVPRFADQVEEAADQILAQATDREIRKNALLWKSNSIAACFRAASRGDPLGAYLDVWTLNRQMLRLFERPGERPLFGPWQGLALETSRRLEQPLQQILVALGTNLPIGEEFVDKFAREHPVTSLYFDRASLAASYIETSAEPTRELMDVVSELSEDVSELKKLSTLYASFLPKQARWQAELTLLATTETEPVVGAFRDLTTTSQAIDRLATSAETTPAMLDRQRQGLLEMVQQERAATVQDIEQMRRDTIADLRQERAAVLQALHDERLAVGETIQATADTSLRGMDKILRERSEDVPQLGGQLIEHAYRRGLQLSLVWGTVAVLCCLLWLLSAQPLRPVARTQSDHAPQVSLAAVGPQKVRPRRVAA